MLQRQLVVAWIAGFLAGAPVVTLGTLFEWPAISFLGAVLLFGVVFFAVFDRIQRDRGSSRHRSA